MNEQILRQTLNEIEELKNEMNSKFDAIIARLTSELGIDNEATRRSGEVLRYTELKTYKNGNDVMDIDLTARPEEPNDSERKSFRDLVASRSRKNPITSSEPDPNTLDQEVPATDGLSNPSKHETLSPLNPNTPDVDEFIKNYQSQGDAELDKLVRYAKGDVGTARVILSQRLADGTIKPVTEKTIPAPSIGQKPDLTKMSPADIRAMASSIMGAAASLAKSIDNHNLSRAETLSADDLSAIGQNLNL